jgi:hypothetical protein
MRAVISSYRGHRIRSSPEATRLLQEYGERKRLAALGFTSRLEDVSAERVDYLMMIDQKIEELRAKDREKQQQSGPSGRRRRR